MNALSIGNTLMALAPFLIGGLLVGTVLIGVLFQPKAKARIVRWLFLPLYFCLSAGLLAYLLFAPGVERTASNFLISGGGMALAIWFFLRGRKADSKSHPEMGTSE